MTPRTRAYQAFLVALGLSVSGVAGAQEVPLLAPPARRAARLELSLGAEAAFPKAIDPDSVIDSAYGASLELGYLPLPFLGMFARGSLSSLRLDSGSLAWLPGISAGLGLRYAPSPRLSLDLGAWAGLGKLTYNDSAMGLYELGIRAGLDIRVSAAWTLGLSAGYQRLATPTGAFMDAPVAALRLTLLPAQLGPGASGVTVTRTDARAIFPVFRSWYEKESFGTVTVRNDEDGPVEAVRVSFFAPEYMGKPKLCAELPRLGPGESATVPLYALFDERLLELTENTKTSAELRVDYRLFGTQRQSSQDMSLAIHHRNAMSWEDDRMAAAFVSTTDPAALWFSRYAASIARGRQRSSLPPKLQYALGIFECLRLYGISYVIDPNSSYIKSSEDEAVVDYLQYPSQTLMYRGGDCDDLSILYCSLLESVGIATAFITIPGHIYMAFDLDLSEAEARERFFDPGLLIFRDGRAWVPVEITMVREGFVKAWRIGAKEWLDNERAATAAFYPMAENWRRFQPSGLQDAGARFALPEETAAIEAFDTAVDRFVAREMEPVIAAYEKQLASKRDPSVLNQYGAALAQAGMLDAAWPRFTESAKLNYAWAWNNLATVAFIRGDYKLAYSYYEWAASLLPGDAVAALGMARSSYELGRFAESERHYAWLRQNAPTLADRYAYLASVYGGSGRAWSAADRLTESVWSRPGLSFAPPVPAAVAAGPAPAPEPAPAPVPVPAPAPTVTPPTPARLAPAAAVTDTEPAPAVPAPTAPVPATSAAIATEPEPLDSPPTISPPSPARVAPAPAITDTAPTLAALEPSAPAQPIQPEPEDAELAAKRAETALAATKAPVADPPAGAVPPTAAPSPAAAPFQPPSSPTPILAPTPVPPAVSPIPAAPAPVLAAPAASAAEAPTLTAPAAAPTPPAPAMAPPAIVEKAPEDAELAAKRAETAQAATKAPIAPTPPAPATALPAIVEKAPEDAELSAKRAETALAATKAPVADPPAGAVTPTAAPSPAAAPFQPPSAPMPVLAPTPVPPTVSPIPTAPAPAPIAAPVAVPALIPAGSPSGTAGAPAALRAPGGPDLTRSRPAVGSWKTTETGAVQLDRGALFAKLLVPVEIPEGPVAYEFSARSSGQGWTGFGLHLQGRGSWRQAGYGGGDSILVWISSDPERFGDASPRLQIYRSRGEVDQVLIRSAVLPGSDKTLRAYRAEFDPSSGALRVSVDGEPVLDLVSPALASGQGGSFILLRALDRAEFSDIRVYSTDQGGAAAETGHE